MKLSSLCISRPVFATVLSLIIILAGILGFMQLHVRFQPQVFKPKLTVWTGYPGASAQEVETSITDKLEKALAGTPNLERMSSDSTLGGSQIHLDFKSISKTQFMTAQSEVLQAIGSVSLPSQASQPKIYSNNGSQQLMFIGFWDDQMTPTAFNNYMNNIVLSALQKVPGAANVKLTKYPSAVRIHLEPLKLMAYGINLNHLIQTIDNHNLSFSAGQLISNNQILTLNGNFEVPNLIALKHLIIKTKLGRNIELKDIAHITVGTDTQTPGVMLIDGHHGLGVIIDATSEANPITVGNAVKLKLTQMAKNFPEGLHYQYFFDITGPLKHSIQEVGLTILESILLVVLVTLLFLGRFKTTLIPIVTIPICLIGACFLMFILGFTINTMTLLALVLAVGLVVDDAIVVLENHHRHLEQGAAALPAAFKSVKEIGFAILGMTLALVAVYLPAGFLTQNATGVYYKQFAYTLAAAVSLSGFVALTLSPMMCGYLLSKKNIKIKKSFLNNYEHFLEKLFNYLKLKYQFILKFILKSRLIVGFFFVASLIFGGGVLNVLPSTFLPTNLINIAIVYLQSASTANIKYTDNTAQSIIQKLKKLPGIQDFISVSGGWFTPNNTIVNFLNFNHSNQKLPWSTSKYLKKIRVLSNSQAGLTGGGFFIDLNNRNSSFQGSDTIYLAGTVSYPELIKLSSEFTHALKKYPGVSGVQNQLNALALRYDFKVNNILADQLGVPISNIMTALNIYFGGEKLPQAYQYNGKSYNIYLDSPVSKLKDFSLLHSIYVQASNNSVNPNLQIKLSRLVYAIPTLSIPDRQHINQLRAALISFNISSGYSEGQVMAVLNHLATALLPSTVTLGFEGNVYKLQRQNNQMLLIFILGIVFIYLVLSALFESFRDPLIILLTVPLCVLGALLCLFIFKGSLNLYTVIGLVTLVGLVSKHGVLITQFSNQLQKEGYSKQEALIQAAGIRLRPILMTTLTMVLGALPLLLASGSGSNGRFQIGLVIISGLILGTVFSLFIVPVAYSLIGKSNLNRKK